VVRDLPWKYHEFSFQFLLVSRSMAETIHQLLSPLIAKPIYLMWIILNLTKASHHHLPQKHFHKNLDSWIFLVKGGGGCVIFAIVQALFVILPCLPLHIFSRWWFQTYFFFTRAWGNDPNWLIFFKWVETTNYFRVEVPVYSFRAVCGTWVTAIDDGPGPEYYMLSSEAWHKMCLEDHPS